MRRGWAQFGALIPIRLQHGGKFVLHTEQITSEERERKKATGEALCLTAPRSEGPRGSRGVIPGSRTAYSSSRCNGVCHCVTLLLGCCEDSPLAVLKGPSLRAVFSDTNSRKVSGEFARGPLPEFAVHI